MSGAGRRSGTSAGHLFAAAALALSFLLSACAPLPLVEPDPTPAPDAELTLRPVPFEDVPSWNGEDHAAVLPAFLESCTALEKRADDAPLGDDVRMGTVGQWVEICADARIIRPGNRIEAKYFFESRFQPYLAGADQSPTGLFTGYYEPELNGRWGREPGYTVPLYSRPPDIVSVDLGRHRQELDGTHIAGRVVDNALLPYYSRAEIEAGALNGRGLEILWVDDPVDAFFLHIQGSGRIRLADGSHVRVGYAGRNGHPYTAIGRELVAMGVMSLADVTAPAIRAWLEANPVAGRSVMHKNRSFVFFRVIEGDGPIGAQGVPLTAGRSLAVDRAHVPLGVPIWLDTTDPVAPRTPVRRLMVAQDTGSAIKGPVRGDVFWGFGALAERRAGLMKQPGQYYLLLPRAAALDVPAS